jgi:hypothetical protein
MKNETKKTPAANMFAERPVDRLFGRVIIKQLTLDCNFMVL